MSQLIESVPEAILTGMRRVIVASPMKCGSTYVAGVLAHYLGTDVPQIEYDWLAEQNLTYELRKQLRGRPFALSLHMRPHAANVAAARDDDIGIALLWRNLGDVIVSFDEHVPVYGGHNPVFFLDDERYRRLPVQSRYRHLIDVLLPWNISFYLHWRRLPGISFNAYEMMLHDRVQFFRFLIWHMGIALDEDHVRVAERHSPAFSRFNVGVAGRSAGLFDLETKRRVERHILEHPDIDELEVLLWELPWEPLGLARRSPYDGRVVHGGDERPWFVSRGMRREVSPRWIASRSKPALRAAVAVDAAALASLPEAAPLD